MGTGYTTLNPYFNGSSEFKTWFPYFPGKHSIWNIQLLNKSRNQLLFMKKKWTFNDVDVVALARKIDTVMKSLPLIEWNSTPNFETRPGQEIAPNETDIDFHLRLIFCRPLSPPLKLLLEENRQVWREEIVQIVCDLSSENISISSQPLWRSITRKSIIEFHDNSAVNREGSSTWITLYHRI